MMWLERLVQDVRFGFRQLRKTPILVAIAVLSLALGIGANTAIFTLINAVMLQSLPVRDPGRLTLFYDESIVASIPVTSFRVTFFRIHPGNI